MSDRTYLEEIRIKNIGVITESSIEISPGLTVLTGETGAGKTMVLTALNLVLGGKSDSSIVRSGEERLAASAIFRIPNEMKSVLDSFGVETEDGSLVLARTVNSDGKSKALAGGVAVPASTLLALSAELVEIHGQSANSSIAKSAKQRELLDRFAGSNLEKVLQIYQNELRKYHDLKDRIRVMRESASKRDEEIALLKDFVKSFSKIKPMPGEISEIEQQIARLSSVEELRIAAMGASNVLEHEDEGVINFLGQARKYLDAVKGKDALLESFSDQISEAFFILADVSPNLSSYLQSLEADPARLEFIQERKAELLSFIKVWEKNLILDEALESLIKRSRSAHTDLEDLEGGETKISELEEELKLLRTRLVELAKQLTQGRVDAAKVLGEKVSNEIHQLSMPHTNFFARVESINYEGQLKESDFTQWGCDEVSMLLQSHTDGPLVSLAKGASGGELSRVMLALEVVLAATHPVGTYIFDEIDAGIGGKAAIEVGRRLSVLSKHSQVIVVTHLAQVAAWADTHYVVIKSQDGTITASGVNQVLGESRVEEIARMLAGLENSTSAREHAAELLAMRV
ncbi:unannotated protein [freshwater metagenome]|uniref:DNA repair protein RecN n=1 Tax=freshwater metagenome TaxID=449393 RepID=A0A6J7XVJ9_9ZZZZ|nr:DNA repair protein RecN [Actinomycetota bacterium]